MAILVVTLQHAAPLLRLFSCVDLFYEPKHVSDLELLVDSERKPLVGQFTFLKLVHDSLKWIELNTRPGAGRIPRRALHVRAQAVLSLSCALNPHSLFIQSPLPKRRVFRADIRRDSFS